MHSPGTLKHYDLYKAKAKSGVKVVWCSIAYALKQGINLYSSKNACAFV